MSMVDLTSTEKRIAERIDQSVTGELAISDKAGGISFVSMDQVMEFAKLMSISSVAVRKHLRGNPGACLGICIQALEWQMSPYSVANKSYSVNDQLAYEAQLIEAVILRRAPIKGRPKIEFTGEGDKRTCKIWAELRDEPGEIVDYTSPQFAKITPKNSPLWKADPDQQHFYYSVRAWCRRHFPDVLLGVYARDEIEDSEPMAAAVGATFSPAKNVAGRLDAFAAIKTDTGETVDKETGEIKTGAEQSATQQSESAVEQAETQGEMTLADEQAAEAESVIPTDSGSYVAYVEQKLSMFTDADRPSPWFVSDQERDLRNKCGVNKPTFDALLAKVKARAAALKKTAA